MNNMVIPAWPLAYSHEGVIIVSQMKWLVTVFLNSMKVNAGFDRINSTLEAPGVEMGGADEG